MKHSVRLFQFQLHLLTGKYFERNQAVASSRESYDEAVARRLWEVSGRLTGLSP